MIEPAPAPSRESVEQAFDFAQRQVRQLITSDPDFFPMFTENGKWRHQRASWTNWCEGFLPGMMWIFARQTGDPWWREKAEHYSRLIEERKNDRNVHDLGFLFWSTYKRWFDWEGDPAVEEVVITAGQTMGLRFNEKGKYLRSFVAPESTFIDIMMNVGIMFYAADRTNDLELDQRARDHCLTTRRFLVRGDGSTAHEGIFDPETGEFIRQSTHQGWRGDSSWARGQSWALYGYGSAYLYGDDERVYGDAERFLDTAKRCARFFVERTRNHGIPPNDWEEPNRAFHYESSAAAIAASGLLQLSDLVHFVPEANEFTGAAYRIATTLLTSEFLAIDTPGWQGILKHGSYHERNDLGVDESVMWGEYFFVELLDKLLGAPHAAP